MAVISGNRAIYGARGRLGEFYYRIRHDIQEICKMPSKSTTPPSQAQLAQRQLMRDANIYAKRLKTDPEMRKYYEKMAAKKKKTDAYHCALSHYMTSPKLRQVDFSDYTGRSGDSIRCQATAWKMVTSVFIKIKDAGGTVIESGPAQKGEYDWWSYTAHESCDDWVNGTIEIEITDDLGHNSILEKNIHT